MKKSYFKSLLIVFVCAFCGLVARAAVPIFSQYGQIQNVQNYSTNPFWSPNAPYNQRLPQPVYVQGADLNADDCIKVVQSLVAAQCMARDNCKNTDLTEIRPTIMVQLSNLPGANYVSACSGYLDGVFESYVQQYGNTLPNRPTAFPSATVPNPDLNDSGGIKFENPYKQQPTKWQMEIRERSEELQSLQNENGADNYNVSATDFPTTYADLSFYERMENERAGLEPYKDMVAYKTINAKTEAEWCSDSSHYNSAECAAYKARQEAIAAAHAAAQAVTTNTPETPDPVTPGNDTTPSPSETPDPVNPNEENVFYARIRIGSGKKIPKDKTYNKCFSVCNTPFINGKIDKLNEEASNLEWWQDLSRFTKDAYCADKDQEGMIVSTSTNTLLAMTQDQLDELVNLVDDKVKDKGGCDWKARKIFLQIGIIKEGKFNLVRQIILDN